MKKILRLFIIMSLSLLSACSSAQQKTKEQHTSLQTDNLLVDAKELMPPRCSRGYVTEVEMPNPAELIDAPRTYSIHVIAQNNSNFIVQYTAYPPRPNSIRPRLKFHAGSIKQFDYIEACGTQLEGSLKNILVKHQNHYIKTHKSKIYLVVRHAERADSSANTNLSNAGINRAHTLATLASHYAVSSVYTTDFCRTAQTVQPSAVRLNLDLFAQRHANSLVNLNNCTPEIIPNVQALPQTVLNSSQLADYIRSHPAPNTVLIAGHSNSVPSIVKALSGQSPCPGILSGSIENCHIPENQFNHLFLIIQHTDAGFTHLKHQLY